MGTGMGRHAFTNGEETIVFELNKPISFMNESAGVHIWEADISQGRLTVLIAKVAHDRRNRHSLMGAWVKGGYLPASSTRPGTWTAS